MARGIVFRWREICGDQGFSRLFNPGRNLDFTDLFGNWASFPKSVRFRKGKFSAFFTNWPIGGPTLGIYGKMGGICGGQTRGGIFHF